MTNVIPQPPVDLDQADQSADETYIREGVQWLVQQIEAGQLSEAKQGLTDMQAAWLQDITKKAAILAYAKALREQLLAAWQDQEEYRELTQALAHSDDSHYLLSSFLEVKREQLDEELLNEIADNIRQAFGVDWLKSTGIVAALTEHPAESTLRPAWRQEVAQSLRQIADQIEEQAS